MVEAFDLSQSRNLAPLFGILLGWVALGALLEFGLLRWLRRLVGRRPWRIIPMVLTALSWQALFWALAAGLLITLPRLGLPPQTLTLLLGSIGTIGALVVVIGLVRLLIGGTRLYLTRQNIASISVVDNLLKGLGVVLVVLVMLPLLGISATPLLTFIAGSSVGIALILRDPIANLFSGLMIILSRRFSIGDFVRLSNGDEGAIVDIRWADTYIRQLTNSVISVPNSVMVSGTIINFDQSGEALRVLMPVRVGYGSDLNHVEQVTIEVANAVVREVNAGRELPESFIRYEAFGESSVNFLVIMPALDFVDQFLLKHEFVKRLDARYRAEGITVPYPTRSVYLEERGEGDGVKS